MHLPEGSRVLVRLIALTAHAAVVRNNAWLVGVRHLRSVPIRSGHHPAAALPLAEAKARFAASSDLATLQLAEIEQVALPSPPGFVVLPTEWSDPCDLRQVLRACPQGRDPTRTSQSDHAPSVSAGYYHRWHKLRVRGFQNPERSSLISKPHATWVALDGPGAVHTSPAARARRPKPCWTRMHGA